MNRVCKFYLASILYFAENIIALCNVKITFNVGDYATLRRSQWPRCLSRRSAVARLLRSWVRIPPVAWRFVCCECCVLSGIGLYDELIPRPEESYRLWYVVCDLETSRMRRPGPALSRSAKGGGGMRRWSWDKYNCYHNRGNMLFESIPRLNKQK
jgi:hypothetical protein